MKTALTIAGSDSSGGAGIQADIKTMMANRVYAMSAVTALTAQNTTGVYGIMNVTPEFLKQQIDAVFTDIFPDAVKIGMVSEASLIEVIAERLGYYQARLIQDEAVEILKKELFPLAELITPNIPEAEVLTGFDIRTAEDMEKAAEKICETYHCSVLLKGGHQVHTANDILCSEAGKVWFNGKRIDNPNTHGTGCTLSSAIASNLANNMPLREAVGAAKEYISAALADMLDLGRGSGPMNHGFALCKKNP